MKSNTGFNADLTSILESVFGKWGAMSMKFAIVVVLVIATLALKGCSIKQV